MAITVVESTTGSANNGGNVTLTFTLQSSDYIVVTATRGTSRTGAMTVTSSSGGSYTNLLGATLQSSSCQFSVWGQLVSSAGTPTQAIITGTANASDSCCAVASVWRGVRSSAPTDATTTSTTGNSSTPDSPSITPSSNATQGDVIITVIGQQATGVTLTAPASFTSLGTISVNDNWDAAGGQAWLTYSSTAAINPANWTSTLAAGWGSATIALAPIPTIFTYQDYFPQYPDFFRTTELVGY